MYIKKHFFVYLLSIIRIDKPSQFDKDLEKVLQKTNGENTYLFFIGKTLTHFNI
jgi:hypothetical protein